MSSESEDSYMSTGLEYVLKVQVMTSQLSRTYLRRDHTVANKVLMNYYFVVTPKYVVVTFRERFRMLKELFLIIDDDISARFEYF